MKKLILCSVIFSIILGGCSTVPEGAESKQVLSSKVDETIVLFKQKDPSIQRFFDTSYGYAVYPEVFKGAFVVGGARGNGEVYRQGKLIGYSTISAATIGFSFGGEFFREIIFFKTADDLSEFTRGEFKFSAQATAVILKSGVAAKTNYESGKAVFIIADVGAMVDASVGGQQFKYVGMDW